MSVSTLIKPRRKMAKESPIKTVKVERVLADRIQVVASHLGKSINEYLSDLIREPINTAYAKALHEMQEQLEAEKEQLREQKASKRKPK